MISKFFRRENTKFGISPTNLLQGNTKFPEALLFRKAIVLAI
jgi:hypothetical protein